MSARKRETLNLRVRPEARSLIDRAAKLAGKSRIDFVLDAAEQAAENAILDRTVQPFSAKGYAEFVARFDVPPRPNKRLRQSLQATAPWAISRYVPAICVAMLNLAACAGADCASRVTRKIVISSCCPKLRASSTICSIVRSEPTNAARRSKPYNSPA